MSRQNDTFEKIFSFHSEPHFSRLGGQYSHFVNFTKLKFFTRFSKKQNLHFVITKKMHHSCATDDIREIAREKFFASCECGENGLSFIEIPRRVSGCDFFFIVDYDVAACGKTDINQPLVRLRCETRGHIVSGEPPQGRHCHRGVHQFLSCQCGAPSARGHKWHPHRQKRRPGLNHPRS